MLFGKLVNRYYIRYLPLLLMGICSLLLVDYFQLMIPSLYRCLINGLNDGVITENGVSVPFDMAYLLDEICRPLLWIILALVAGRFIWRVCFFGTARMMETDLRRRMFAHAETLSVSFYNQNKVGNMMALFTNDIETVQECFGNGVLMFFDALLLGILAIEKMLSMDRLLTLLAMIPMAFLLVVGTIMGKHMKTKWRERQEAFSDLSDFTQESFSGFAVVKAFVKETLELLAFRKLNRRNEKANVAYTKASTLLSIFVTLFVESVVCIILGYGGYLVHIGHFDAGELVEFISYFTTIVWPIMAVTQIIEMQSRGKASLGRIDELMRTRSDMVDQEGVILPSSDARGEITFRNLSFSYPNAERQALSHLSFTIKAGERVGVIGRTGSGKTTLADLILRAYNVEEGTLFIDGNDVCQLPIRWVRDQVAYVPQDNFLFSDTIENNIAFGVDEPQTEKAKRAAALADVHDNIEAFPEKYQTMLGERGVTVSGGQKQRISIARALMKDAPILILDDSLSAVDTATEKNILTHLAEERQGKTTLLIAHRISTVKNLDRILLIDEGQMVDMGTHEELLARCPLYGSMVELQRLEEEKSDV